MAMSKAPKPNGTGTSKGRKSQPTTMPVKPRKRAR